MKLKIVNSAATTFHEAVGISEERSNELSRKLDDLVMAYGNRVIVCDTFNDIANLCDNTEELVYCIINHANWLAVKEGYRAIF